MPELFIPALFTILFSLVALAVAMVGGVYLGVDHQRRQDDYDYGPEDDADPDYLYNIGLSCGLISIIIILLTLAFVAP